MIRGFYWASKDRILYLQDKGGDENYHVYGVDVDGQNDKDLTPFEGVRVNIIAALKEDEEHVIVQMNKDNPQQEEPYRLNINTGEVTNFIPVRKEMLLWQDIILTEKVICELLLGWLME